MGNDTIIAEEEPIPEVVIEEVVEEKGTN